jgi:large subunit ribosomal protein L5
MAKQKTPPPQQPQGKKATKEQKTEKLFETGDGAIARITPRLRTHYEQVVRPQLQQQFNYRNPMQIPRLEKIVINMGVGKGEQEPKQLENAVRDDLRSFRDRSLSSPSPKKLSPTSACVRDTESAAK